MRRKIQSHHKIIELYNGHGGDFINILIPHGNRQRFLLQTHALTFLAGRDPHKGLIFGLGGFGTRLLITALHIAHQPFESHGILSLPSLSFIIYGNFPAPGPVHQHVPDRIGILLEGSVQVKMIFLAQGLQKRVGKTSLGIAGLPAQHHDGALIDGKFLVGNHQFHVKFHLIPQAEAHRAGSEGIVEGEAAGFHLTDADTAVRAGKTLGEIQHLSVNHVYFQKSFCQFQHILNGIRQTLLNPLLHHQAIHHDLYIVLDVFLQRNILRQFIQVAVHPYPDIAALLRPVKHLLMQALPSSDHRRQQLDSGAFSQFHNLIHHLVHRLPGNDPAALGAMGNADTGVQQAEVVVDLRHRAHRGTGIAVGGLLVYGDGRGQPVDPLHIGLLHLPQELPGVRRKGFHIPALSLGIDGVKRQGGFAGSRHTRQDYELVPGYIHINVLEIVLAGSSYLDVLLPGEHLLCFFHVTYLACLYI